MERNETIRKLDFSRLSFGGTRSYESAICEVEPLDLPARVKNGSSPIVVSLPNSHNQNLQNGQSRR